MQSVLMGPVEHTTKCTFLKGVGWGCRVFVNGQLNQEIVVHNKEDIGRAFREMLRMEDKCGNISDMAHNARMRPGRKSNEAKRKNNS